MELEAEPSAMPPPLSVGDLCLMLRKIGTPWPSIAKRYKMTVAAVKVAVEHAEADHAEELGRKRILDRRLKLHDCVIVFLLRLVVPDR